MLTLENFEQIIDSKILSRGKSYFTSKHVRDLEEDNGVWTAAVYGSEIYEVEIEIDPKSGEITAVDCDCPYEFGPYCKHMTAVLFAVREALKSGKKKSNATAEKRQTLKQVVESLSKEQLCEIVLTAARKDKTLASSLLLRYSVTAPDKPAYVQAIKAALAAARDRDGFIEYAAARRAAEPIYQLLDEANEAITNKQPARAIPILQAVIEVMPSVLNNADDSNGDLGGTIDLAFNLFNDLLPQLKADERSTLFVYFIDSIATWEYQGFDYDSSFLWLVGSLVDTEDQRDQLYAALDSRPTRHQGFLSDYQQETIIDIKQGIMSRLGASDKEIHDFLLQHVHLDRVRRQLIQRYIDQEQFVAAAKLAQEGLGESRQNKPGLVKYYNDFLLEIARREGKPDSLIRIAEEQFLHRYETQYYEMLKKYVSKEDWPAFLQRIISHIQSARAFGTEYALAEIYVQESMWPQLLKLAQNKGVVLVERYKQHLYERYPGEMCDIYEKKVFALLKETTGRTVYEQAAECLRRIIQLGEPDRAGEIIERLKLEYPKRKAMIEELNKVSA